MLIKHLSYNDFTSNIPFRLTAINDINDIFRLLIFHTVKPYINEKLAVRGKRNANKRKFERNQFYTDCQDLYFVPDCRRDKTVWLVHKVRTFFPAYTFPEDSRIIGRGVYFAHD